MRCGARFGGTTCVEGVGACMRMKINTELWFPIWGKVDKGFQSDKSYFTFGVDLGVSNNLG
eukprot:1157130-Pelagomonas_calceolata.AAC.6